MPDALEHNRSLRNGKDGQRIAAWSPGGLGNTNPTATLAPTLGSGAPMRGVTFLEPVFRISLPKEAVERALESARNDISEQARIVWTDVVGFAEPNTPSPNNLVNVELPKQPTKVIKPAGQVVLFKRIMEDWEFNNQDAATLLGFEAASDIEEIYLGAKSVGHRDANDRLRAILRIATDLDALFQEVAAIRGWLSEPQTDLDGETPRSLLTDGSMETLLRVKSYVAYLSGR